MGKKMINDYSIHSFQLFFEGFFETGVEKMAASKH